MYLTFTVPWRSSRDNASVQSRNVNSAKNKPKFVSPLLPPPPSSKKANPDATALDYLSGDVYSSERSSELPKMTPAAVPLHPSANTSAPSTLNNSLSSSPPPVSNSTPSMVFTTSHDHAEPLQTAKSSEEHIPPATWDVQSSGSIPPPPSKYNQRQQFFDQQQPISGDSAIGSGSGSSYDGLVGRTQNLSLLEPQGSSTLTKQAKPEEALFKDLVDFAMAKPSAKPGGQRTLWATAWCGSLMLSMFIMFFFFFFTWTEDYTVE